MRSLPSDLSTHASWHLSLHPVCLLESYIHPTNHQSVRRCAPRILISCILMSFVNDIRRICPSHWHASFGAPC